MTIEDNLVDPQRWNRYTYTLGNPLAYIDADGKVPVLVIVGLVWGAYEIGSSIYDVYSAVQAWRDSSASTSDRIVTTLGAGASLFLPGGGYGTAARFGKEALEVAPDAFRAANGLRDFTARNARENLIRLTGSAVEGAHAHHVFPQWKELSRHFEGKLNVNDPRFLVWWESKDHLKNAAAYNKAWLDFFGKNPKAGLGEILRHAQSLADRYGFHFSFEM